MTLFKRFTLLLLLAAGAMGANGECTLFETFDDPTDTGACCVGRGDASLCIQQSRSQCERNLGTFQGGLCAPGPCDSSGSNNENANDNNAGGAIGSCCEANGFCRDGVTIEDCALVEGTFNSVLDCAAREQECSENASDFSGCCLSDGNCVNATQQGCEAQGGSFQTQSCTDIVNCDVLIFGACCDGTDCISASKFTCEGLGRTFKGGGTRCGVGSVCP